MAMPRTIIRTLTAAAVLASVAAHAHHGWSWAEEEQTELTGTVTHVQVSPPHPVLQVDAADGSWRVELGNPRQTERSGFTQTSVKEGDEVTAIGNRSKDSAEKRLKAVQLRVGDQTYDLYPERIQSR